MNALFAMEAKLNLQDVRLCYIRNHYCFFQYEQLRLSLDLYKKRSWPWEL